MRIISTSRQKIKALHGYLRKVDSIKKVTDHKYQLLMKDEKNRIKRMILRIKKVIEIRREMDKLTSLDKMYLMFN
jgi:hypothetical protein